MYPVKKAFQYLIVLLLGSPCFAQTDGLGFQDSVRVVLENTKSIDASAIGASFGNAWINLSPDQQLMVKKQAKLMKKRGYKIIPHFVNYYGVLTSALDVHKIDPTLLSEYLELAGKTIEKNNSNLVNIFFQQCRGFFAHHALTYEKFFKLYAADDEYSFEYLEPAPPDTTQNYSPPPVDTTTAAAVPAWQQPITQPEVLGPAIIFKSVSLNFVTPYDSAFLKKTKGIYSLRDRIFVGEGGTFDWSPAGLGVDSVFYELKKYNFKTNQPAIKAEQGNLSYTGKLPTRVPGVFEFKSINHKNKKAATYPRFKSYLSNISITGLASDSLKYTGGFGLQGAAITSQNVNGDPATIEVSGNAEKKFKAQAFSFAFKDSIILANSARIVIYQGYDSITHPSMQMIYNFKKQSLFLSKDNTNLRKAPFASTYFGMDFTADDVRWNLKSDSLSLSIQGSGSIAPMVIESHDFYDPDDYETLRGQGFKFHPLAIVVNYATRANTQDFMVYDLVAGNVTLESARMAMDFLAQKGAIQYDPRTGKIHVNDKSMHLIAAVRGKVDYDNLKIHSLIDTIANATINLKKNTMTVWGVEEFKVSDSLKVKVKPDSGAIQFLKDRDIKFRGTIEAGNFEITGKDFMFKYDSFYVNLKKIDSIRFYVTDKDGVRRRVNNAMKGADSTQAVAGGMNVNANQTSGTLYINHPDNKSGKIKYPHYPNLDASAGGVITFNKKDVLNGAYDQSIYFVVPPFKLDSLNDADPAAINFEGTFVSNGMFPTFRDKLHTMPDNSLGFTHDIPKSGYDLFGGPGKLYGNMRLDNQGIRANGRIDYLAATVQSDDFVFYQDSVLAKGTVGDIKEMQIGNVKFPHVSIANYQLKWFPKQDKFKLKNTKDPFSLYKNTATLNGVATVSKAGVTGSGWLNTRGSEVFSRDLAFNMDDFRARHARFDVKTGDPNKPALQGKDVRIEFDLAKNVATVSPEIEGVAAIDFPYAQFKTSITKAVWDLNTQKIQMTKAADVPIENSYFYTTRKELDSLSFNAEKAEYDIKKQQLKVSGIPYIIVADAKITPDHNEVLILENAKIGQLKNTVIVLDTLNGYHRLTEGVVDIVSRKEFSGYATYQYVNAANDTFAIKMTNFHLEAIEDETKTKKKRKTNVKATMQTVASGAVDPTHLIHIAPRIYYKGDMVMFATRPALELKGFVKLDLKKIKNYDTWIAYDQSGDEKEIYLDFDHSVTEAGRKVAAGLHFGSDNSLYISFVFDKKDESDDDFFLPSGSLFFDKETGEFKIEDRQKAAGEKLSGKIFNYNEEKQEVKFEGEVNFFKNFKDFSLRASAIGSGNLESNEIKLNSMLLLNMNIPTAAYQTMALKIQDVIKNEGANEALGDQAELLYKIANITDEKTAKDYETKSQQGYVSLATIPQLGVPVLFPNVNFKWSQAHKAFYSEGQIGVSNIGRTDINGAFEGFMEIRRNEDGTPVFHVFFKASPEAWYYYGYEDNRLMIHSSDPAFNDIIAKKTNAAKSKVGELTFIPGSDDETLAWINKFRLNYYKLEAPYDLTSGTEAAKKKEKKKDAKEDDGF